MPSTVSGLLVILFAVLPGVPGNNLYQRFVGSDRKEEQWSTIIRIIGFSVGGLILYILLGYFINAPLPIYISPSTFTNFNVDRNILLNMSLAFSGHVIGSILISFIIARIVLWLNRLTRTTSIPDTWDKFANECVANHWIVVSLIDGKALAGVLERADVSVEAGERDIILKEPAEYRKDIENYVALNYQHLFIPGSLISTIGVWSNDDDSRITTSGASIFPKPPKKSKNRRYKDEAG